MMANNASKSKIFLISINDDQKLKNNFSESSSFERIVPPPDTKQKDLHNMSNFEIIRNVESSLEDEDELSTSNRGIQTLDLQPALTYFNHRLGPTCEKIPTSTCNLNLDFLFFKPEPAT